MSDWTTEESRIRAAVAMLPVWLDHFTRPGVLTIHVDDGCCFAICYNRYDTRKTIVAAIDARVAAGATPCVGLCRKTQLDSVVAATVASFASLSSADREAAFGTTSEDGMSGMTRDQIERFAVLYGVTFSESDTDDDIRQRCIRVHRDIDARVAAEERRRRGDTSLAVGDTLNVESSCFFVVYGRKRVEAIGADWVVVRDVATGVVDFADVAPGELVRFREGK